MNFPLAGLRPWKIFCAARSQLVLHAKLLYLCAFSKQKKRSYVPLYISMQGHPNTSGFWSQTSHNFKHQKREDGMVILMTSIQKSFFLEVHLLLIFTVITLVHKIKNWNSTLNQCMRARNLTNVLYVNAVFHKRDIWSGTLLQFMSERNKFKLSSSVLSKGWCTLYQSVHYFLTKL